MTPARSYRDLIAWQKAMELAQETYRLAALLPERERFGMWSQITRAAASVPANLAEGHARQGRKEFAHFVSVSCGSVAELETFILLAVRLGYFEASACEGLVSLSDEVGRMLTRLHQSLNDAKNP